MAGGCHIAEHTYRTFPLVQKVLLDSTAHELCPEASSARNVFLLCPLPGSLLLPPEAFPLHPRLGHHSTVHLDCSDPFLCLSAQEDFQLLKGMS